MIGVEYSCTATNRVDWFEVIDFSGGAGRCTAGLYLAHARPARFFRPSPPVRGAFPPSFVSEKLQHPLDTAASMAERQRSDARLITVVETREFQQLSQPDHTALPLD